MASRCGFSVSGRLPQLCRASRSAPDISGSRGLSSRTRRGTVREAPATFVTLRSPSREEGRSPVDLIETRERSGNRRAVKTGRARRATGWREKPRFRRGFYAMPRLNPRAQRLIRPADGLRIEAPFRDRIFHGRVSTDEDAAASLANLGDDPMTFGILADDELQPGAGVARFHARCGTERTSHRPAQSNAIRDVQRSVMLWRKQIRKPCGKHSQQ